MTSFLRCVRCVMPNSRPDTPFRSDGVCGACVNAENRPSIDWDARKQELIRLLDKHDGRCIVPSSGGKDSTYQVLKLKELGATPIAVTATTCMLTDIGRRNIDNLARHCSTVEVTPNRDVRAKLNRLGLTLVGDISWPEHVSIFRTPFKAAIAMETPLIFYGESPQNHYGGPPGTEEAQQMTQRWVSEFGGFLGLRASDMVGQLGLTEEDMEPYQASDPEKLASRGVEAHFLGQYLPWDAHENARIAVDNGFEVPSAPPYAGNWWYHENLDSAMTGLHDWFGFLKFGYGRGAAQLSIDIRNKRVTREFAMQFVEDYDGLFPVQYMGVHINRVLERINMTSSEFLDVCNQFLNRDLFVGDVRWGKRPVRKELG